MRKTLGSPVTRKYLNDPAKLGKMLADVIQERDALVVACKGLLREHPCGTSHLACKNPTCAATIARAAIAKAESR